MSTAISPRTEKTQMRVRMVGSSGVMMCVLLVGCNVDDESEVAFVCDS